MKKEDIPVRLTMYFLSTQPVEVSDHPKFEVAIEKVKEYNYSKIYFYQIRELGETD